MKFTRKNKTEMVKRRIAAIIAVVGEQPKRTRGHCGHEPAFLPTPQQIDAVCRAIQATWTDAERDERRYSMPDQLVA